MFIPRFPEDPPATPPHSNRERGREAEGQRQREGGGGFPSIRYNTSACPPGLGAPLCGLQHSAETDRRGRERQRETEGGGERRGPRAESRSTLSVAVPASRWAELRKVLLAPHARVCVREVVSTEYHEVGWRAASADDNLGTSFRRESQNTRKDDRRARPLRERDGAAGWSATGGTCSGSCL